MKHPPCVHCRWMNPLPRVINAFALSSFTGWGVALEMEAGSVVWNGRAILDGRRDSSGGGAHAHMPHSGHPHPGVPPRPAEVRRGFVVREGDLHAVLHPPGRLDGWGQAGPLHNLGPGELYCVTRQQEVGWGLKKRKTQKKVEFSTALWCVRFNCDVLVSGEHNKNPQNTRHKKKTTQKKRPQKTRKLHINSFSSPRTYLHFLLKRI